jgi:CHAT domain-containing protein
VPAVSLLNEGASQAVGRYAEISGDFTAAPLMAGYYDQLVKGVGRVEAMRQAALAMRKTHPHPYYWAPFIALGRPDPL